MNETDKKLLKLIIFYTLLSGGIVAGRFKLEEMAENKQEEQTIYQEDELENLYQLTREEETDICFLDSEVYHDVETQEAITVKGYESEFGYDVIHLEEFFSMDEQNKTKEKAPKIKIKK